jgi:hypothetical protein
VTKTVRYQEGHLYVHHNAWYVRYRERVRREGGSIKLKQRAARLGSVSDYPFESQIKPLFAEYMCSTRRSAMPPNAVRGPVARTSAVAVPP